MILVMAAGKSAMSELDDRAWSDAEETDDDEAEKEVAEPLAEDPASDDGHAYHYHRGHGGGGGGGGGRKDNPAFLPPQAPLKDMNEFIREQVPDASAEGLSDGQAMGALAYGH